MNELDGLIAASSSLSPTHGAPAHSPLRLNQSSSGSENNDNNAAVKKKLEECYTACKILQASGKRLELDGYWWRGSDFGKSSLSHPIQLDVMTRQYCQNVEVCLFVSLLDCFVLPTNTSVIRFLTHKISLCLFE
jgi:hypothetical protein